MYSRKSNNVYENSHLKKYTPDVITSIVIVLPDSSYTYYRLLKEQVISGTDILRSTIGAIIILPILFLFLVNERNKVSKKENSQNFIQ
jgi:hypothetical protein